MSDKKTKVPPQQQQNTKRKKKNAKKKQQRRPVDQGMLVKRIENARGNKPRGIDPLRGYRAMANMVVDPQGSPTVLLPDRVKTRRAVRKFMKVITVKATDAGCAAGCTILAAPELEVPVYYTGGATPLPVAAPGQLSGTLTQTCDKTGAITLSEGVFTDVSNNKAYIKAVSTTHTDTYMAYKISKAAGVTLRVSVSVASDETSEGCNITVYFAATGAAAWTSAGGHNFKKGTNEQYEWAFGGACDHVAVAFTTVNSAAHSIKIGIDCSAAQVFATDAIDCSRSAVIQTLQEAQGGRVTAMSMLCTNVSPPLSRGGQITMARLPMILQMPDHTTLPNRFGESMVYVGDASLGGYAWWLPSELSQSSYLDKVELQDQLRKSNFLYARIDGWAPDSVFQIKVTYVVEFFIDTALYEKIEPPLVSAKWERLIQLLGSLPACSCNPDHEGFKEYIKWGATKAGDAVQFVAKHSAELLALAELIASLA